MELILVAFIMMAGFFCVILFFGCFNVVGQGTAVVLTRFGKFARVQRAGLNFKLPIIEASAKRLSLQNQSVELNFQAITFDQANVHFKAMLLYSVLNSDEETILNVAFKFVDERSFMIALTRSVEGSVRAFVATKKQAEILALRREIIDSVKDQLDQALASWGYHLIDLQINDIGFDEEISRSMAKVVASSNLKAAAENEGQALLITKTKGAEAEGNAIKIAAEAERQAAQLRGQGIALFRGEVAKGMTEAAAEMAKANLDVSFILFSMWTESIKHFAEYGKGNIIFLDGSPENMQETMKHMMGMARVPVGALPKSGDQ
ncbi:MAG: SPFH domain-containing protein [Myxococcales bacterium]|nr:SPFH domain-containing protein [Myxococcales bacterium]